MKHGQLYCIHAWTNVGNTCLWDIPPSSQKSQCPMLCKKRVRMSTRRQKPHSQKNTHTHVCISLYIYICIHSTYVYTHTHMDSYVHTHTLLIKLCITYRFEKAGEASLVYHLLTCPGIDPCWFPQLVDSFLRPFPWTSSGNPCVYRAGRNAHGFLVKIAPNHRADGLSPRSLVRLWISG